MTFTPHKVMLPNVKDTNIETIHASYVRKLF